MYGEKVKGMGKERGLAIWADDHVNWSRGGRKYKPAELNNSNGTAFQRIGISTTWLLTNPLNCTMTLL